MPSIATSSSPPPSIGWVSSPSHVASLAGGKVGLHCPLQALVGGFKLLSSNISFFLSKWVKPPTLWPRNSIPPSTLSSDVFCLTPPPLPPPFVFTYGHCNVQSLPQEAFEQMVFLFVLYLAILSQLVSEQFSSCIYFEQRQQLLFRRIVVSNVPAAVVASHFCYALYLCSLSSTSVNLLVDSPNQK
jgi:hypothetical protein